MAKTDVLSRVRQDLAHGHTHTATQRLRTLVAIHPDDLELRTMLAAVCRQTGNLAEAGRWAFLTDDLRPDEWAAFEHANPDPGIRLRLLRWGTGDPGRLSTEARERFTALVDAAARPGPGRAYLGQIRPEPGRRSPRTTALPCLFVLIAMGTFGALATAGLIRAVRWVLG